MNLYLVRHGIAEEAGGGRPDHERPLSEKGWARTREAAQGFARLGLPLSRIVSSPFVRAAQTAEAFAAAAGFSGRIEPQRELGADEDVALLARWLRRQPAADLMLVGHMPNLGALASLLACGRDDAPLLLRKAAVCRLSFDDGFVPGTGNLEWYLPAGILRMLAKA